MSQQHMFAFAMRRAFISLRHHPVTTTTDDVRHSICKGPERRSRMVSYAPENDTSCTNVYLHVPDSRYEMILPV